LNTFNVKQGNLKFKSKIKLVEHCLIVIIAHSDQTRHFMKLTLLFQKLFWKLIILLQIC